MGIKLMIFGLISLLFAFPTIVLADDNEELKFGFYVDRVMVSNQTILFNQALNKRITEIGNRIAKASDKPNMKYILRVINTPIINAYSASGGFVYINTGLLDVLEIEDELAFIIAHEVAHTCKNHQINFQYSTHRNMVAGTVGGIFLGFGLGVLGGMAAQSAYSSSAPPSMVQQSVGQMYNIGFNLGGPISDVIVVSMIKGYGKGQELEADALAVRYTKKAGYNPNASIGVFKKLISIRDRLGINEKNYTSSLINAEPGLEERIQNAEELISKAK
jgi:predicted Zn-dependent protease